MSFDFNKAFALLMVNEVGGMPNGGYVNNPADPGGETKYGISKHAYPNVDIAALTEDGAKAIYESDYWLSCQCDAMPWAVGWVVFDCAVNHGHYRAVYWLQKVLGMAADGYIGPVTIAAVQKARVPVAIARDITLMRDDYAATLSNYPTFKQGWRKRFLNTLIGAVQWTPAS